MRKKEAIIIDDEETHISKIAVRIPPFWPEEPELWFMQLEGQFTLCGITDDEARYAHVLSKIEPKQAREIKDVITRPPTTDKYKTLKRTLIQRLTDSQEQRIRQLLEREELGDRKPSQFLRHLSTLAGSTVPSELIRTLWLGRLPAQIQAILATRTEDRLEDIADQADRIYENGTKAVVATASPCPAPPQPSTSQMTTKTQVLMLTKQIAALTAQMSKLTREWNQEKSRNRARSRSRDQRRFRHRSRTPKGNGICFYHQRFGQKAEKCTQPCAYKKENE